MASKGVSFTRDLGNDVGGISKNNSAPAVIVNYRPDFLFTIPQQLLRNLTNWSQGGGL